MPRKRPSSPGIPLLQAKKKRLSNMSDGFPCFADGDVSVSLGALKLKLHSQKLRDTCQYFAAGFAQFPQHFVLDPRNSPLVFAASANVPSADPEDNDTREADGGNEANLLANDDARMLRTCAANDAIFRLLYRQPILCTTAASFQAAATLATKYGCIDAVKDGLVTAILKASLGTSFFQTDPCALLNSGYILRDETIFTEALIHVVGRGGGGEFVSAELGKLVGRHVAELEARVEEHWQSVLDCCHAYDLPQALAASQLYQYFHRNGAFERKSPLESNRLYKILAELFSMNHFRPLLCVDLIRRVEKVDNALIAGIHFVGDESGSDADSTRDQIHEGYHQNVCDTGVDGALYDLLKDIKRVIKPLFIEDRKAGYFIMQFSGPFPWAKSSSS